MGAALAQNIERGTEFPEQIKEHEEQRRYFREVIMKRKDLWDREYRFWQEKRWL